MKSNESLSLVIALLLLAVGIAYASTNIYKGLTNFRIFDRYVTVKGLATKDVRANLGLWPIAYIETGNNLVELQGVMDARGQAILNFLQKNGIPNAQVELQRVNVQDLLAQSYRQGGVEQGRYILTQTYLVRTEDVQALSKAAKNVGDLIRQGIVLAQGGQGPTYLFTQLNDVKPDMIAQATKNAREAADRFAADSGQKVGSIRRAYQGMFQILARDQTYTVSEAQQMNKTVRVVSTVDFYLE